MSKKTTVSGILLVLLVLATTPLLGTDNVSFLKWWLMTLVLGIGFIRLPQRCFRGFMTEDGCFLKCLASLFPVLLYLLLEASDWFRLPHRSA